MCVDKSLVINPKTPKEKGWIGLETLFEESCCIITTRKSSQRSLRTKLWRLAGGLGVLGGRSGRHDMRVGVWTLVEKGVIQKGIRCLLAASKLVEYLSTSYSKIRSCVAFVHLSRTLMTTSSMTS
jgi:hypothetical protein